MNIVQTSKRPALPTLVMHSRLSMLALPIGYLLLIFAAEALISFVAPVLGMLVHSLLVLASVLISSFDSDVQRRRLPLALALLSLSRILALTLPGTRIPDVLHVPLLGILLFISAIQVIRQLKYSRAELGFGQSRVLPQLAIGMGGFTLGTMAYALLLPQPIVEAYTWQSLGLMSVSLVLVTGFGEELIYRGLLQSSAQHALGAWAVVYGAVLYTTMQLITTLPMYVGFVLLVSLLFGQLVRWSGSLLGVSLAHALMNLVAFVLMPYLSTQSMLADTRLTIAMASTSIVALLGMFWLAKTHSVRLTLPATRLQASLSPARLRKMRHAHNLTIIDLALRSEVPARLIAEIENGWREATSEQLIQLFETLHAMDASQ